MRTTIVVPETEHALFRALARARGISMSAVKLDLCDAGLNAKSNVLPSITLSAITGLPTIASSNSITNEMVSSFLNEH